MVTVDIGEKRKHLIRYRKALRLESEILSDRLERLNKEIREVDAQLWGG